MILLAPAFAAPLLYDSGLVVTAPAKGAFAGGVNAPAIEYDRRTRRFVMYFESPQSSWPSTCVNEYAIGRATSRDGVTWTLDTSPVFEGDEADATSNRHCGVSQPAVVYDGTTWHLFYAQSKAAQSSTSTSNENGGLGYATSTDGITFTVVDDEAVPPPSSRTEPIGMPSVVLDAGTIYLYYTHYPDVRLATRPVDLSSAWSYEGVAFDKDNQAWSSTWVFGPSVSCHPSNGFTMWLLGDAGGTRSAALATSTNGWDWSWDSETPVASGDVPWSSLNHFDHLRTGDGLGYGLWYSMTDSATGLKAVGYAGTRPRRTRYPAKYCP